MNYTENNQGLIKGILMLLLLVGVVAAGFLFGEPYYRYMTLQSQTKDILMKETGNLPAIKTEIMQTAKDLNVPLKAQDLKVSTNKKVVKVNARWSETVDFWGYYQKRLDFDMKVEY
jgi:hypothetical protein